MKLEMRRDSIVTIGGFALLTGTFLFLVYLPGHKAAVQLRREIDSTRQTIGNVPQHVAELESLHKELDDHKQVVRDAQQAAPTNADVHTVINQVADLARHSDLVITRLQPGTPEPHASYQQLPFQLTFTGPFHGAAAFLQGIESNARLFTVQKLVLKKESGKNGKAVQGDMNFSVYISDKEFSDFAENDGSVEAESADTGKDDA